MSVHVFASSQATSSSITGAGYVLFVLGGLAAATAVQDLYERAYAMPSRGSRTCHARRSGWQWSSGSPSWQVRAGPHLGDAGGPILLGLIGLVALVAFWWFTMWFLLAGRVSGARSSLPAVATAICWVGMELVFRLTFSNTVISDYDKYGAIGVVFGAHVVADRDRSGDHPRCDRRGGLARPWPLARGSLQAAAEAQRADLSYAKTTVRAPFDQHAILQMPTQALPRARCARCRVRSAPGPRPTRRGRRPRCPER